VDAAGRIREPQQYEGDRLKVHHKIRGCMAPSFPRASGPPRFGDDRAIYAVVVAILFAICVFLFYFCTARS
jgi:hypothetical protein